MSDEEMRKAMKFIVNQQAHFAADIQKLQEAQAQMQQAQAQVQQAQIETGQLLTGLAAVTVKGFEDTNAKLNALVDAPIRTEGNLNNPTSVVTKYFSSGQNGD